MNNETIDYTLICNDKQEIVSNKNCHHWSVRNKEIQFVWIFSLGPRFRVRCPYLGIFPGQWTVRIREVSVRRGSTVYLASRFCHITLILYELRWLPVTFRIEFKVVIITHKAIYGTAPNYLSSLVNFKPNSSYSLRSNSKYLLSNPNFRTLPTLGDRAFVAAAPKLWNNPPLDVRCTSDFQVFKRNLKTHLFKKAFSDIML